MLNVRKRDGTIEEFDAQKINNSIERETHGLDNPTDKVVTIASQTELMLYDGITTQEIDEATINAALQNVQDDPDYDIIATRLLLKTMHKKILGTHGYEIPFRMYVTKGVENKLLDPRMESCFDLEQISAALVPERDELFKYAGLSTLLNRYAIKGKDGQPIEMPQFFFMRVAMGLSYNEENPTEWAIKFYDKMSKLEYIAGGSTNIGAGTTVPALSNCFLLEIHDDMQHIAKSVGDVMMLSKAAGGIGASVTKLRASGSSLSSNNTNSSGPTPFAKIIDTAIRAIQRGGKKKGALCFYMENWHYDFPEFIDWKHNAGDDYLRMRTANTAAFLSDEFMKRVQDNETWFMFDPKETPDLNELYGEEFSKRYNYYGLQGLAGKLNMFRQVPAREQYRNIITALISTSHPWLVWKDTINLRALNNNTGTIHMSNLCTEITLPQDKDNIAVCNLASINLARHVIDGRVDWGKLAESTKLAVRQLDNLIDINQLPIPEAVNSDKMNRAIGLGVMGLSDMLEQLGMAYEDEITLDLSDQLMEFISWFAILTSSNLAAERGSYPNYRGSGWSQGKVPFDTILRGYITYDMNWNKLRGMVSQGMRNATLMAIAPNANIGLVAGTTPGIDPRFAQIFSRNKISGKYIDVNPNLVAELKQMGMWETVRGAIMKAQGDISEIDLIPAEVRRRYMTSFSTSPHAFIEVAARAQKWVDQAISRNMYLETRDVQEVMDIYMSAWQKGLKSTYYLHMKPRHTAEQSNSVVNKASNRVGFGGVTSSQ